MIFKEVTRPEWIEKITTDLKGKVEFSTLDDKEVYGIPMSPFAHDTKLTQQPSVEIPSGWKTGLAVNGSTKNEDLLQALSLGVNHLTFSDIEQENISQVLKDVRLDYLTSIWIDTEAALVQNWRQMKGHPAPQDIMFYPSSSILFSNLTDPLEALQEIMTAYAHSVASEVIISLNIDRHFFFDIARARAIRILIANIDKALDRSPKSASLHGTFQYSPEVGTDESLIHESSGVLSSLIGGLDVINVQSPNVYSNEEVRRSINIQNVFRHESKLDIYNDLSNGSFYIEDLTKKIVDRVWESLSK